MTRIPRFIKVVVALGLALIISSQSQLIAAPVREYPGYNAQAFSTFTTNPVVQLRGARANLWTAQHPGGYDYIEGMLGICTGYPLCANSGKYFDTGYKIGTLIYPPNQLQQAAQWVYPDGDRAYRYNLGNLNNNTWYQFQVLFSNTAQRWEAWRGTDVVFFIYGLNFTSGATVICGAGGRPASTVPIGTQCDSMRYRTVTGPWTLYDYTGVQLNGSYSVYRPYVNAALGWGPTY